MDAGSLRRSPTNPPNFPATPGDLRKSRLHGAVECGAGNTAKARRFVRKIPEPPADSIQSPSMKMSFRKGSPERARAGRPAGWWRLAGSLAAAAAAFLAVTIGALALFRAGGERREPPPTSPGPLGSPSPDGAAAASPVLWTDITESAGISSGTRRARGGRCSTPRPSGRAAAGSTPTATAGPTSSW